MLVSTTQKRDKPFFAGLEAMITEGPDRYGFRRCARSWLVRKMVGGTEPKSSSPGTIRGDFAMHSYSYADAKGAAIKNLIHASGNVEEAKGEVAYGLVKTKFTRMQPAREYILGDINAKMVDRIKVAMAVPDRIRNIAIVLTLTTNHISDNLFGAGMIGDLWCRTQISTTMKLSVVLLLTVLHLW